jgi:hypothetical protein
MTETEQITDLGQMLEAMADKGSVEMYWVSYYKRWEVEWHTWGNGKFKSKARTPAEAVRACWERGQA